MSDQDRQPANAGTEPVIVSTIEQLRAILDEHRSAGGTVGFVPTMGYLHDGHASLMRAARASNDLVVASIFVNPLQFAPTEDLSTYPRDLDRDTEIAASTGVDLIFAPSTEEMYPHGEVLTTVSVSDLSQRWDGESRPTHFAGVATVVTKLFAIVGACRAYFGQKDFQQLTIISRIVDDLSLPVTVVGCPIAREADGLAMSSRNIFLSAEDRQAALVLHQSLDVGAEAIKKGERDPDKVKVAMTNTFAGEPRARLDYVAVVDPATLTTPTEIGATTQLLVAAYLGETRLIDNQGVQR